MRKNCGFTLVEILVGIALFAILSVAAFSFMQSSMTATLSQKTQQQANDNAKAILTAVTTEMKSSYREPAALTMDNKSGYPICNYKSSVIYPATAEASTADGAINTKKSLVAPSIDTDEGLDRAGANKNEVVFYTRTDRGDFYVVRYAVIVENGLCRVDRFVYNWSNHAQSQWSGIRMYSNTTSLAVDGMDIRYYPNNLGNEITTKRTTIASLPSVGDAAILYVARSWDDTYGGGLASKLSANQYFVKVLVFQTLRGLDEISYKNDVGPFSGNPTTAATFSASNAPLKLFRSNNSDSMKRRNYRAAELDGIVNVSY